MKHSSQLATLGLLVLAMGACIRIDTLEGDPSAPGVDTGGAQDIAAAREMIARGGVPPADWITAEGLLSEHDVAPAAGAPCQGVVCLRPAFGVARSLETGEPERWIHLGMTSGLRADFTRPPVDLVVAIDKSSSMSIDLQQTTEAVARLAGHLRAADRLAVLAFDDRAHVLHELGPITDLAALQASIRGLSASGSYDIAQALATAYQHVGAATPGRMRRVILLSCSYPAIGGEAGSPTVDLVRARAQEGIGVTFVGVLLGWSRPLSDVLGTTPGANYYYLSSLEAVESAFDTDLDSVLTPLAYDLDVRLSVPQGWKVARVYGLPGQADAADVRHQVATAFLSRKGGSIVARLERTAAAAPPPRATVSLSYRPEPALGLGSSQMSTEEVMEGAPSPDGTYYQTPGVRKAVALVNMAMRMIEACTKWRANEKNAARRIVADLVTYLRAERAALDDAALDREIELAEKLQANMLAPANTGG